MWIKPSGLPSFPPALKVFNSLTKAKDELKTINGKILTWYCCGPTVYDSAHLGHARAYISFDIIRRIISDYFGYTVNYVMNITDIDDKIILKARQKHLLEGAISKTTTPDQAHSLLTESLAFFLEKNFEISLSLPLKDLQAWQSAKSQLLAKSFADSEEEYKFKSKINLAETCLSHLANWSNACKDLSSLWSAVGDVISLKLDNDIGHSVTDQSVFSSFASFYEQDFMQDMRLLNVQPPTVLTRVSEYVEEIIQFVQKIIFNGYGYESEGSVYFNVAAYHGHNGHEYAKLRPQAALLDNAKAMEEGEGSLGAKLGGKRSPKDFVLWKRSKTGEPMWDSPWGKGRPGWHIECSAMASSIIPGPIDLHSGGIDLAFPHHDNEIAQSEAFYQCHQWVNYFLHAGHLNIEGQKMSKSLKNFITIKEALKKYTGRQIRIMFLQHSWNSLLDFKDSSLKNAISYENSCESFFSNIKAYMNDSQPAGLGNNYGELEKKLRIRFDECVNNVAVYLADAFDTPSVMVALSALMGDVNLYVREKGGKVLNKSIIKEVSLYVFKMLKIFGVYEEEQVLFSTSSNALNGCSTQSEGNQEKFLNLAKCISEFRFQIRNIAAEGADKSKIFAACDELRDSQLLKLGVFLEDRENQSSLVKLIDQMAVMKIQQERINEEAEKQRKKQESLLALEQKEREKMEKAKINPMEMFRNSSLYSEYDELGIPVKDVEGKEISKSLRKKLVKEHEAQSALYAKYQK
jgi:cysteinyl-tRNA synthetase